MEQRVDRYVYILSGPQVTCENDVANIVDVGSVSPMIAGYPFGKTRCAPRVQDVGKILLGVDFHLRELGTAREQTPEGNRFRPSLNFAVGCLVEQQWPESFCARKPDPGGS